MEETNNVATTQPTPAPVTGQPVENKVTTSPAPEQSEENKRELNKTSQLETELTQTKREVEEAKRQANEAIANAKAIQNDLNDTFEKSPKAYQAFAEDYNRLHPERPLPAYNEVYKRQEPEAQTQQYQPPTRNIALEAATIVQQKMALDAFNVEHPELSENKVLGDKVTRLADFYMGQYSMTPQEALKEAYASVPENRGKQVNEAKEEGQLMGTARDLARGAGESSAPSGSGNVTIPSSSQLDKLNSSQRKRYQELASNPKTEKIASRYLGNILNPI